MSWNPIGKSCGRPVVAAAAFALVLALAPIVPMLDAAGNIELSASAAYAKGKGGGKGGGHGHGDHGHADRSVDSDHGHSVGRGHSSHGNGLGLGHDKARGYGHHHDPNYDGEHRDDAHDGHYGDHAHEGHHGDHSDGHSHDRSFSGAMDNAKRDFGRVRSKAKAAWSGLWD